MGLFSTIYKIYKIQNKRSLFFEICKNNTIDLNYQNNIKEVDILSEIFYARCYSDYFPFYEKVNIIDIGAHKGYFSIFASKNTSPESKIIAIEPFENNINILRENLKDNNIKNVEVLQAGIYSESTEKDLYIAKSENNSIFEEYNQYLNSKVIDSVKVNLISIKELLEKYNFEIVDFMKIDCEGAEYHSLFQSDQVTLNKIKVLSIEFHDLKNEKFTGNKLVTFLENKGFKIAKFYYDKTTINNNFGKIVAINSFYLSQN